MSLTEVIIRLLVVALLVAYLCYRRWQREREQLPPSKTGDWVGKGIDVTSIKPALEDVRRTHARPRLKGVYFHRGLLALARRAVGHFAYFQEREPERADEKHAH